MRASARRKNSQSCVSPVIEMTPSKPGMDFTVTRHAKAAVAVGRGSGKGQVVSPRA
jgi:hypothetical protein